MADNKVNSGLLEFSEEQKVFVTHVSAAATEDSGSALVQISFS